MDAVADDEPPSIEELAVFQQDGRAWVATDVNELARRPNNMIDIRSHESVVASELTRFELLAGARPDEHDRLGSFFSVIDWVPVSEDIARRAGEYAHSYRRSHSGTGVVDYLLAGTVSAVGADLVTINVRHFPMFDDLRPPYGYGAPEPRRTGH